MALRAGGVLIACRSLAVSHRFSEPPPGFNTGGVILPAVRKAMPKRSHRLQVPMNTAARAGLLEMNSRTVQWGKMTGSARRMTR